MKYVYSIFIGISVFILSTILLVKQNTTIIFGDSADLYTATISLEKNIEQKKIDKIITDIKNVSPQIIKTNIIDSREQITDLEKILPAESQGLFENEELSQILNPLIEVQFSKDANQTDIISKIKKIQFVANVVYSADWIDKFKSLYSLLNSVLNSIFILFYVLISFLIAILIQNYIVSENESVSLHALLGASPHQAFIKYYFNITIFTSTAYFVGVIATFILSFFIQRKLNLNTTYMFLGERITALSIYNLIIIFSGLFLNLTISYFLSYKYVVKKYYKNE